MGSKRHGKKSSHFNENEGNIELLLRTVISVKSSQHLRSFKIHPKIQKDREHLIQMKDQMR